VSPLLRAARPEDRDPVVELLHTRMNAKIPRERWALLFDYPWRPADAPDCGRVLEEGEQIVGYLGATYVDRVIGAKTVRICNMSSWYLLRDYRGKGYGRAMVQDLTSDPEVTYTDLTATPPVHTMLLAHAGFAVLEEERWLIRRSDGARKPAVLLEASLDAPHLRQNAGFRDVRILRAETENGACTLAMQIKKKHADITYHQVLHVDEPWVLARDAEAIATAVLPDEAAVLAVDRRLIPVAPKGAVIEAIPQPRLFKSQRLQRNQIDNLYNEVLLLDQKLP
jgi:GNAT superfamily N-acetyltransferase